MSVWKWRLLFWAVFVGLFLLILALANAVTLTIIMLAPNATPNLSVTLPNGDTYLSDVNGLVANVPAGDVNGLQQLGFIQINVRNNVSATTNPTASNDYTQGYGVGSMWINATTPAFYLCTAMGSTPGNATWQAVTVTGIMTPAAGGTGINNGSNTITVGGNLVTGGALTTSGTGPTTLAFPSTTATFTFPSTSKTLMATDLSNATLPFTAAQGGTGATSLGSEFTNAGSVFHVAANGITPALFHQGGANTLLGNPTGGTANEQDVSVPSCPDSGGNHLNYGSGTISCGTTSSASTPNFYLASGFVNKLRGTTLSQWYGGTSISVTSSLTWTAEGIGCLATGANVLASQVANPLTAPNSFYALKLAGNTSNTDLKCRFVIESYDATLLAGQRVTFQIPIQNNTGGALVATIATKYPSAQDNWSSSSADLAATNLQSCASGATCTLAYTFNVNAGATNGYEIVVDFGVMGSGTNVVVGGGFDLRLAPGVTTGLNSSPSAPEVYTVDRDRDWDSRFYQTSYANGSAPGTVTHVGMVGASLNSSTIGAEYTAVFPVSMRITPSLSYYDGAGAASTYSGILNTGTTTFADGLSVGNAPFNLGPKSFIVGYGTNTNYSIYMHYAADARIPGG